MGFKLFSVTVQIIFHNGPENCYSCLFIVILFSFVYNYKRTVVC